MAAPVATAVPIVRPGPWVGPTAIPRGPIPYVPPRPIRVPAPPAPLTLPASPGLFPWLERRFSPGEATVWVGGGRPVEALLELLYAGVAASGGRISLLEGANRFHPYRIGERARSLGIDPGEALDAIRLARAFTGYQMVALVEGWAREVKRTRPTLLVAHEVPALFFETEFPEEERAPLLQHAARLIEKLVRSTGLPILLTSANGFAGFPGLKEHGPRVFDLVRITSDAHGVALEAYREATRLSMVHRPDGQRGLEEFGGPIAGEVTPWDGRSRPTGRRSKSG